MATAEQLERFRKMQQEKLSKSVEEVKTLKAEGKTEAVILGVPDAPEPDSADIDMGTIAAFEETADTVKETDIARGELDTGYPAIPPYGDCQSVPATLSVNRTYKDGQIVKKEEEDIEQIEVGVFRTTPAEVSHDAEMVVNMGNYETIRLRIGVKLPAYVEEIDSAYLAAKKFVDSRLNSEIAQITLLS